MKAWVVVVFDYLNTWPIQPDRLRRGEAWIQPQPEAGNEDNTGTQHKRQLYFADDEDQAQRIAETVSRANPGKQLIVAKSMFMLQRPIGDPVRSKFTEKGVVPV